MSTPAANFYVRIAGAARQHAERPAIEVHGADPSAGLTYAELASTATRFAVWLTGTAGIARGDRVAILAANDARWVAAYLGILRMGAVAVPLDTAYTAAQVRTVLLDSGARLLFTSDRLHDTGLAAVSRDLPVTVARLAMPLDVGRGDLAVADVSIDDAAAILYTSGTTDDPKGVVLTHGNLEAERASALAVIHVTEQDVVLGVLPLFHALAQMANLLLPLSAGARVVFLETIDSTTLLDALQKRGITVFACVPQFFYLIHQRVMAAVATRGPVARGVLHLLMACSGWLRGTLGLNPGPWLFGRVHHAFGPRMRMLITGGSRFDPAIARDLHALGLTLLNGYGLTETSGAATVMRPGDRFTTSVGPPLPGVEIRIDNTVSLPSDDPLEAGAGEILIRGGIVMREYHRRTDATAAALDDGWLRTGDLGRLDDAGRLYITGRLKDVIVLSSGKNLYPEEIEAHYRQSPFIRELCVLGLADAAAPSAERLHAVIVPDDDALKKRGIVNVGELIRFEIEGLSVQLPAHKRVLTYEIAHTPLARTTTGKLRRQEIARSLRTTADPELAGGRVMTGDERAWLAKGARAALLEAAAERLNVPALRPDDSLELDLHLDSMERVELLSWFEQRTGAQTTPEQRAAIATVRQLVEAVESGTRTSAGATTSAGAAGTGGGRDEWQALLDAPPEPGMARMFERPSLPRACVFAVVLRPLLLLLRLCGRVAITGRERIPATGPYILAPNHQSYLDPFVLLGALPFRTLRAIFFVGASEYFEGAVTSRLAHALGIVPIDPDARLVAAMQAAAAGLRHGKALLLFPEGERTIDGRLRPFRRGVAILSSHIQVPIVPVALTGTFEIWPRGLGINWARLLSRGVRINLSFAPAMQPGARSYADITASLEHAVGAAAGDLLHNSDSVAVPPEGA